MIFLKLIFNKFTIFKFYIHVVAIFFILRGDQNNWKVKCIFEPVHWAHISWPEYCTVNIYSCPGPWYPSQAIWRSPSNVRWCYNSTSAKISLHVLTLPLFHYLYDGKMMMTMMPNVIKNKMTVSWRFCRQRYWRPPLACIKN